MHGVSYRSIITLCLLMVSFLMPTSVFADGTETLGPPSIPIATGTDVISAGSGLAQSQPGTIDIFIPDGVTIKQVLLYWEGAALENDPGDDSIIIEGIPVTGTFIGTSGGVFFMASRAESQTI